MKPSIPTLVVLSLLALSGGLTRAATNTLVAYGSTWKYLDNGTDQGTAWRGTSFNDTGWASGPAQLGYSSNPAENDEATAVSFGPDANNKYITTYFRRAFTVATPALFTGLTLTLQRDDGAVVYLNGTEVFRSNMPAGTISSSTLASTDYTDIWWWQIAVNPALLVAGTNVLAVEVHQFAPTSTDLAFDLQLLGDTGSLTLSSVTRGPYLQTGTPTSLVIRWRTDTATNSRVLFGTDPASLNLTA